MPEGDSIHRLAATLAPALVGRVVRAFSADPIADDVASSVVGHTIEAVEARGKNLLVTLDDRRVLHVHLRMSGRVRIERPRSAFWRPRVTPHQLRLAVDGAVVVGDRLPVLRLLRAGAVTRTPDLEGLGPDLLGATLDPAVCVARLRGLQGDPAIADALLVQRALAGIGNVYKSEVLFLAHVDPRTPLSRIDDPTLLRVVGLARDLLRRNVGRGPRTTRPALQGPRLWVYGRGGRPCLRCGGTVERFMQGAAPGRSTYHCPGCQPASRASRAT